MYGKASSDSRSNELNVTRHGIFTDSRLNPHLVELVARLVDSHARLKVVDTAENEIDRGCAVECSRVDLAAKVLETVDFGNIVVVAFDEDVWVDSGQRLARCFDFGLATLLGTEEQSSKNTHIIKLQSA